MNYYTFEIDGEQVGYFEYQDDNGVLYQNARLLIEGEKVENPFWVKHEGARVLAYRCGEGKYVALDAESGVVPSAAVMLLLEQVSDDKGLQFLLLNEGSGEVVGEAELLCSGDSEGSSLRKRVQLWVDAKAENYFVLESDSEGSLLRDRIIEFGWGGGACSRLVGSRAEAVAGTIWED